MQAGDPDAFAELYDRHAVMAYSIAYRICGRELAEDVTQVAFMDAWRNSARYKARHGSFTTWLLQIVRNRAIDAYRKRGTDRKHRAEPPKPHDGEVAGLDALPSPRSTDADVAHRERASEIQAGLVQLPEKQREVIELAFFGGLSHSEIATSLELPPGTVKGRMRHGLEKMRGELTAGGDVR